MSFFYGSRHNSMNSECHFFIVNQGRRGQIVHFGRRRFFGRRWPRIHLGSNLDDCLSKSALRTHSDSCWSWSRRRYTKPACGTVIAWPSVPTWSRNGRSLHRGTKPSIKALVTCISSARTRSLASVAARRRWCIASASRVGSNP